MLSFSYTVDLQLEETLSSIDILRTRILSLPISMKSETKLQWESMAIRIWATLSLSDYNTPKQYVATILSHPTRLTRPVTLILNTRAAYDYIHSQWRGNPKPVTLSALETIFTLLYGTSERFETHEHTWKELLEYLATEEKHPVVQAAIAHMHVLTLPDLTDAGLLARAVQYLYLAKSGYDIRGYIYPERAWLADKPTYMRLAGEYNENRLLSTWLLYIAGSLRDHLELLGKDIQESRFHISYTPAFWDLNDRQKEILALLTNPETSIRTKTVQKRFRTSQITASRDLTRLAALGLIYPHGKGRSIYYTKI